VVPAHIWTPWFSLFGANSGFDHIYDCFGEEIENIFALETGLSSDPKMNWRVSWLDRFVLLSNSDAHSPMKIAREANVFDTECSYKGIVDAIKKKDPKKILKTIEFFPEEGKYHFDGHRQCGVLFHPRETRNHGGICPVCKGQMTTGVMHRVEILADREDGFVPSGSIPYINLVPLVEIISEAEGKGVDSAAVEREYKRIVQLGGGEMNVLMDLAEDELPRLTSRRISDGILRVRKGDVDITPGYDGVYGKIKIFKTEEEEDIQLSLF
jgi:uncharacterized protein (TIGR00375 family)